MAALRGVDKYNANSSDFANSPDRCEEIFNNFSSSLPQEYVGSHFGGY